MLRKLGHCCLILLATSALSAQRPPAPISSPEEAIEKLGDRRFTVREQAMQWLWEAGEDVRDELQQALESSDRETALRARVLLERLTLGIRPDTPAAVVRAIRDYRRGTPSEKAETLKRLLERGSPQVAVRLIRFSLEHKEEWIHSQIGLVLPHLVLTGQLELAEDLLKQNARTNRESNRDSGAAYRSFLLATGRLDAAIAAQAELCRRTPTPADWADLALLYRTQGNYAKAIEAARKCAEKDENSLELLLNESGQFAELARRLANKLGANGPPQQTELERYGYLLAFYDLAGDHQAADRLVKSMLEWDTQIPRARTMLTRILLANGRFTEAMPLIEKDDPLGYFNLLRNFERWDDAFQWLGVRNLDDPALEKWFATRIPKAGKGRRQSPDEFSEVMVVCALLDRLGRPDLAAKYLDRLFDALQALPNHLFTSEVAALVERELSMGLRDQAFRHAAAVFGRGSVKSVTAMLYPDRAGAAIYWWNVFRGPAVQDPFGDATVPFLRTLEKLGRLMDGQMSPGDVKQLVEETAVKASKGKPSEFSRAVPHLAEMLRRYGMPKDAIQLLQTYKTDRSQRLLLGDLLAETGRYREAAEFYNEQVKEQPDLTLLRFLEALCWQKAGEPDLAADRLTLANQLVSDALDRVEIADQLAARHWYAQAAEQLRIVIRTLDPSERDGAIYAYTLRKLTQAELADEVPTLELLRAWRWNLWRIMDPEMFLSDVGFYPYYVFQARFYHAKHLLETGKPKAAIEWMDQARQAYPAAIEIGEIFVPQLRKQGLSDEANRIFNEIDTLMTQLCQRFPKSALYLNNLAWMYARCDEKMDKARELAERAVELEPRNATYIDTLAEVEFRRGNHRRAVELARRCIQLDPDHHHYRRQLVRFTAEATADRP